MKRRPSLAVVVLGALATGGVVAAFLVVGAEEPASVTERTASVRKGVVQTMVSGTGNLAPAKQADVDFSAAGTITAIYVEEGERVTKGQLLARLDRSAAEVELAQAQASLTDALDQLETAQSSEETTATAAATTTTAALAAQATPTPQPTATPEATATPRATATPTPSTGESSGSGSGTSVASAQAAVAAAEAQVQEAETALADTDLRAPIAGTVASVSGAVGDEAGGSATGASESADTPTALVVLARLSRLKLEVSLSESDIGEVRVGQRATVTVNAASGEQLAAHVTDIGVLSSATSETGTSTAVSYPVTLLLDQRTAGLRAGMSATADIVTARASGLVVPNQALSGSTLTVERDGARTTARVQTGVTGDSSTQIVNGVKEGDTVVIRSTTAAAGAGTSTAGQGLEQRAGAAIGAGGFGGGGPPGGGGLGGPAPGGP